MSKICGIILVQPPFVQLNSPYPAPYYLRNFLETRGLTAKAVTVLDHSIGLFERIFSRSGLEQIFSDVSGLTTRQNKRNRNSAETIIIERFLSERELWLSSIERLIAFLRGRDPEWGHLFALANGCLPGGPRVDRFLAKNNGEIPPDEVKLLASWLLSDLADFITCTLDRSFSLIRYTPVIEASLNSGLRDFAVVKKNLDGYIMNSFYRPMLNEEWDKLERDASVVSDSTDGAPFLLGLTIPFPGCLSGALVCADSARNRFGSAVRTVAGGGYVNTELRFLTDQDFFDYFDYVSFDRGYGSLVSVLEHIGSGEKNGRALYRTIYRFNGTVIALPDNKTVSDESAAFDNLSALEDEAARTVFPDYSGVDFSRYLYPVDDVNPMHRLWNDGHWLKAYLAHGCYWHSCAFCDVSLDYIGKYIPVDPAALFTHLKDQAEKTGVRGVHLVDESAPVSSLLEFAMLNREAGLPLCFWGNIRFEKEFTADVADILAAGGLIGVSAGLEVATERGFKRLGKGINLESAIRACVAFKEAGILTHAYLIYGYWDEDEQEIIDSAEILRQFFAEGLLDSAFWHKFVLTRHSRIYAEKQRGLHPGLTVKDDPSLAYESGSKSSSTNFALNDLSFDGEEEFDKYSEPLEKLLGAWMGGNTEMNVSKAFHHKVKAPSVSGDLVPELLSKYINDRDFDKEKFPDIKESRQPAGNILFLGSVPRLLSQGKHIFLTWRWKLEDYRFVMRSEGEAGKIRELIETASRGRGLAREEFISALMQITKDEDWVMILWLELRDKGLAAYPTDSK